MEIDPQSAQVKDLVEILENDLAYTEGLSLVFNDRIMYDVEYDDDLTKQISHFGISNESILTVMDESDERVNLDVLILERYTFLKPPQLQFQLTNGFLF